MKSAQLTHFKERQEKNWKAANIGISINLWRHPWIFCNPQWGLLPLSLELLLTPNPTEGRSLAAGTCCISLSVKTSNRCLSIAAVPSKECSEQAFFVPSRLGWMISFLGMSRGRCAQWKAKVVRSRGIIQRWLTKFLWLPRSTTPEERGNCLLAVILCSNHYVLFPYFASSCCTLASKKSISLCWLQVFSKGCLPLFQWQVGV